MAAIRLFCVAPHLMDAAWIGVKHYIEEALLRANSDFPIEYIEKALRENKSQLWVAADEAKFIAAMTTEICGKTCVITALGGDYSKVKQFWPDVYKFARDEKCEVVRLYGRPGWIRVLKEEGFQQPWIALEKRL